MHLEISHSTRYDYDRPVQLLPHLLYLRPRENPLLQVNRFDLGLNPVGRLDWMRDDFDNITAGVRFDGRFAALEVRADCAVTTAEIGAFDFLVRDYASMFPFHYEPLHGFNLGIYRAPPSGVVQQILRDWLAAVFLDRPHQTVCWLLALNQAVYRGIRYKRRDEPGIQDSEVTIRLGTGSCRDLAMLLIECVRTLGLAARFVSGYMHDPTTNGAVSGAMHAWVEVYLPGAGWRGLDPTHGIFCHNAYVPVAHAVVAESVNPIQGSFFSSAPAVAVMRIDVRVRRLG